MKELLNKAPSDIRLQSIDHPGFSYGRPPVKLNSFPSKKAIVAFKGNGGFYGHVGRYITDNFSNTACLSAFGEVEANNLVRKHNEGLES